MDKRYKTPASVERTLLILEREFGLSTADFYAAYYADDYDRVGHIPQRHCSLWASLHRAHERMTGGESLAERVGDGLHV